MNRSFLLALLTAIATMVWTPAGTQVAFAHDGAEQNDPRIVTIMGSYSGTFNGPWTGATRTFPNGAGITIGVPDRTDNGTVRRFTNWEALHMGRLMRIAQTSLATVEFEFNSSEVEEQYDGELDRVAKLLLENPEIRLSLAGHTDLVGTEDYNQALGERRAEAVRSALVKRGVPAERLRALSYGELVPLERVETPLRKNRRVNPGGAIEVPVYLNQP